LHVDIDIAGGQFSDRGVTSQLKSPEQLAKIGRAAILVQHGTPSAPTETSA
jgi:hypothetical protein